MRRDVCLVLACVASAVAIAALLFESSAHADPAPGLWQEQVTHADGVTMQKIRDTTGGDHNVCYVASARYVITGQSGGTLGSVSISCVPEKP